MINFKHFVCKGWITLATEHLAILTKALEGAWDHAPCNSPTASLLANALADARLAQKSLEKAKDMLPGEPETPSNVVVFKGKAS